MHTPRGYLRTAALKFGQITCNFYRRAKTLQVQGKDGDDLKNNLISLSKENGARTGSDLCSSSTTAEVPNQDGVVGHQTDETNSHDGVDFPTESQAIDESDQPYSPQCAYVSHFNTEIENLKKELLDLRLLVSSSSLCSPPTSDSVEMLNKLKHENDLLSRELISQKEQCKSLSEERDSLKLVVQLLSKDLYKSKLTDAPPPSQEKSDTGTDMAVKVNFPPPKVTHHTTNPPHSPDIPGETTVILGDSIIQNLQGYI